MLGIISEAVLDGSKRAAQLSEAGCNAWWSDAKTTCAPMLRQTSQHLPVSSVQSVDSSFRGRASNMGLCSYCRAIPFDRLPAEDEAGLPHQPHLPALQASVETCSMCDLLCQAAYRTRSMIVQQTYQGNSMPVGWTSFSNRNSQGYVEGKATLRHHYGHYNPGTTLACGGIGRPLPDDAPGVKFVNDERMKCYLYGNWYKTLHSADQKESDSTLQLIGMGMRLGTSPLIEDGEGNSLEESHCRGSALRVRTMEGEWAVPQRERRGADADSARQPVSQFHPDSASECLDRIQIRPREVKAMAQAVR